MAYQFSAEKRGVHDLLHLHGRLTRYERIEFFPVEIGDGSLTLGISIPFKATNDPRFEAELVDVMKFLIVEQEFQVTDLYTGNQVDADNISSLAQQILG